MPVARFQLPDGRVARFEVPDGTTPEQAQSAFNDWMQTQQPAAVETQTTAPQPDKAVEPRKRTMTEEALRQLGLTARAGITGITGVAGAVADTPFAIARAFGAKTPLPSEEQQKLMTRIGIPEPEGAVENISQVGASMLAGAKLDPVVAKLAVPRTTQPLSAHRQVQKEAMEEGYRVTPRLGGGGQVLRSIEGASGVDRVKAAARARNAEVTDALVKRALGLPKTAEITDDVLAGMKSQLYKDAYEPIDKIGNVTTGRIYREALDDIVKRESGASKSFPDAIKPEVKNLVDKYRVREFDARDAREAIATLRQDAGVLYKSSDPTDIHLARANKKIAAALEEAIELNLAAKGERELLNNFKQGRTQFAKIYEVERALAAPGEVDATKLAASLRKGKPLTGELKKVARFAQAFPQLAVRPTRMGDPPMVNTSDLFLGGAGSMLHPSLLGVAAGRGALGLGLTSPLAQRALMPTPQVVGTSPFVRGIPAGIQGLQNAFD